MQEICHKSAGRWQLKKIAMAHRTGVVGIGHPSVIIAASSAHRGDALEVWLWPLCNDMPEKLPAPARCTLVHADSSADHRAPQTCRLHGATRTVHLTCHLDHMYSVFSKLRCND